MMISELFGVHLVLYVSVLTGNVLMFGTTSRTAACSHVQTTCYIDD